MISLILTIYEWLLFVAVCFILYPIALVLFLFTAPFDKKKVILHRFSCFWGSLYVWLQPWWSLRWEGKENIEKNKAYVIVSNHQSLLDIFVIYSMFRHFKWVAKDALLRVPFVGWNMALNGYIIVKRNDTKSQIKMMKQAERTLNSGSSIMIFPEGTRSHSGELGRFKRGAFILAEKTDLPVIPIALDNMHKAVKHKYLVAKSLDMKVKVFPPVYPKDYESNKEMSAAVKGIISSQLEEWRK